MPETTKVPLLQDQIDKVEHTVHHTPFRMFVTGAFGGIFFGVSVAFGQPWTIIGAAVLFGCIGICAGSVRNAKEEYKKLLEQLNS
jgi:hypothetical protein